MRLLQSVLPEIYMGLSSLLVHKLRTGLTMLGMIFGVGAVVAMLAITAGVEKEMLSYIDLLGVNNIIIEAKEAVDRNELQARRAVSPGMTFRDFRAIMENTQGLDKATARKRFKPLKVLPKTAAEPPMLIGVEPSYRDIQSLKLVEGRFFNDEENNTAAAVCVLGETAKVNLLGYEPAVGKFVKINDTWLQVIGVMASQSGGDTDVEGVEILSRNNLVVSPLRTVMFRFEDGNSFLKDEIDGIYIRVNPGTDSIETAAVINAILAAVHKDAGDYTVTVPAGLLEQKKRTSDIFKIVMPQRNLAQAAPARVGRQA